MKKVNSITRVVHVAESFGGGVMDFIYYLTSQIEELEHIIIYSKDRKDDINIKFPDKVIFKEWRYAKREINPFYDFLALLTLINLLKRSNVDVIHLHSSKAGFLGRVAGLFLRKKKIIYTPNGASFKRTDVSLRKRKRYAKLENLAHKLSGEVICCSYSEHLAFKKIRVNCSYISNGVLIPKKVHLNLPTDELRICCSGRITFQKGPGLFNQIASLFVNHPNVKFIWIGEGELKDQLKSSNIIITGWLSKELALQEISKSHIYLSTSYWEGLPYAVLDAMALGKPLILNNCVGNVDLVAYNENGFIFNTADEAKTCIERFIEDKMLVGLMGNKSRDLCFERFDAINMANQYRRKYVEVRNLFNT